MIELHQAVFNVLKADTQLLNLLGLDPAVTEADISKRLTPTFPSALEVDSLIHFTFPTSYKSRRNYMFETRPIQFRIFTKDPGLIEQQHISNRIEELLVGQPISVGRTISYEQIEYCGEGQIPGRVGEHYGWFLELEFQNVVKHSN